MMAVLAMAMGDVETYEFEFTGTQFITYDSSGKRLRADDYSLLDMFIVLDGDTNTLRWLAADQIAIYGDAAMTVLKRKE